MYNPAKFKSQNINDAFDLMDAYPFATVISVDEGLPIISHIPITPIKIGEELSLISHLACANPHSKILTKGPITAVFHGPHTYISPMWYGENDVPTWNYSVVHVSGVAELIETNSELIDCLQTLTAHIERHWPSGWDFFIPDDLQGDDLAKHIVGFKIKINKINFKNKLSQNRPATDREGILKGLETRTDENSRLVGEAMRKLLTADTKPKNF